ncbi:hypothetical protein PI125_g2402 [Phytophthora idaei]|nr:hypothetical protein PI125_g2402 [Phytophthora idaei]KAG3171286.1 hypothetical protein PI126_g1961 [Phytophthora idaei]
MIHDVFGHGQYAQHALMENESAECLTDAVTSSSHLTRRARSWVRGSSLNSSHHRVLYRTNKLRTAHDMS